jgi:hypothetical protein
MKKSMTSDKQASGENRQLSRGPGHHSSTTISPPGRPPLSSEKIDAMAISTISKTNKLLFFLSVFIRVHLWPKFSHHQLLAIETVC